MTECDYCYNITITKATVNTSVNDVRFGMTGSWIMYIKIDFNSDEAIYVQLRNQIIVAIATAQIKEGDSLPSVRSLADDIGINMHTVNKAYATLRQDGFLRVDRRRGAVVAVDMDKLRSTATMKADLRPLIAQAICKGISKEEAIEIIDQLYEELG